MDKTNLEKVIKESEAVQEAIKGGIPPEEAIKLYIEANRKAESGEWVEIPVKYESGEYKTNYAEKEDYKYGTSSVRYWTTFESLQKILKDKKFISPSKAENLFKH